LNSSACSDRAQDDKRLMTDHFDPYYTWLGIPPDEQPADYYRLLGVRRFETNEEVIVNASDQRMAYLRTFQVGKRSKESQQLLNEVATAQGCLLHPKKKQTYDEELRRKLAASQPAARQPATPSANFTPVLPVAQPAPARATPVQTTPIGSAPARPAMQPLPARPAAATALLQAAPLTARPLTAPAHFRPGALPHATSLPPLDALGSLEVSAKPLRPAVAPQGGLPLPLLIAGGSAAAVLIVLVGCVAWMVSRPSAPIAKVAPAPSPPAAAPTGDKPAVAKSRPPSPPPAPPPTPVSNPPIAGTSETPPPMADVSPVAPIPVQPSVAAGGQNALPRGVILGEVESAAWRGGRLAVGAGERTLFWNDPAAAVVGHRIVAGGKGGGSFHGASGFVLSPDASHIAFISDGRIQVFLTADASRQLLSVNVPGHVKSAAFSDDNRLLAAAPDAGTKLAVIDLESRTQRKDVKTQLPDVEWLRIRGDFLCCCSAAGEGEFISLRNPTKRTPLADKLEFPPAGLTNFGLMTFTRVNPEHVSFHYVRPDNGQRWAEYHVDDFANPAQLLAMSHGGDIVVVASRPRFLAVVELPHNKLLTHLDWPGGQFQVAAVSGRTGVLAVNAPLDKLWLLDMRRLLEQPEWRVLSDQELQAQPARPGEVAGLVPAGSSAVTSATGSSPPVAAPGQTPAAREAMNVLRAARVSLSGSSDNVFSIRTANSSFGPEHAPLLAAFPQLSSLYFIGHENIGAVLAALPAMPAVKTLTLDRSKLSDSDLVHLAKFPQLDRLSLVSTGVGPGLEHLGKAPNLRNLTLPANLSREAIPFISRAKQLQTCSPWPRGLTDDDLAQIAALENLTGLSLSQAKITGAGIDHLQRMPKLERVYISQTAPRDVVQAVSKLNLKYMSFPMGTPADDIALYARMPRLTSVTLPGDWTREHLRALAMFPVLNDLHLSNAKIADRDLALLADIKSLREVAAPITLTDSGAAALAQAAHLERLEVTACRGLTDRGVADLAKIPALKQLLLGPGVGDGAIAELVKLPALESLSFDRSSLTAQGLGKLEQCRSLKSLALQNIVIDGAGVAALKKLSWLSTLSIFNGQLPADQAASLKQALPQCSVNVGG